MKLLQVGFIPTFTIIFLASSFITGSPILNDINYSKQFWIEFIIITYTSFGIFFLWYKKDFLKFHFTLADAIVILILIIYLLFVFYQESNPLVKDVPFFYMLYYSVSKLELSNHDARSIEVSTRFFLIIVPLVIIAHIAILILQKVCISPYLNENSTLGGTFGNPDMLGSYLAVLMPFCFMQVRHWKILGYVAFVLCLTTLIFLQARTSLMAIICCGLLWLLLNKHIKLVTILMLLALLILLVFLLILWHPESVYGRFFIWLVSIKMIAAKPFGWGLYAFEKDYPKFQASILSDERAITSLFSPEVVHSPFNEFLNIGVTIGIIALILIITLFCIIFYNLLKSKDRLLYPFLSFFIISLFYFPFKISPLLVLMIPIVACISNKNRLLYQIQCPKCYANVLFLFLILVSAVLAFKAVHTYKNFKHWQYAYSLSLDDHSNIKAEQLFAQLYPRLRTDGRFLISYSNVLNGIGKPTEAMQLLEEAGKYFCDITLSLKLAQLYEYQGFYSKAEEKYNFAISLAPDRMIAAYEKILFLQRTGKFEEAYIASLDLLNRPVDVSPFADTYIILNRLKKLVRDFEKGIEK